jgi:cell division protease FtsH
MSAEPDYSDEIAREIDDEIRRVIEEAHASATRVLSEHMDVLHRISAILIERETIDKDQFVRLLAGESEDEVFAEPQAEPPADAKARDKQRRRAPTPRPFPLPGQAMQPPPPEPSKG